MIKLTPDQREILQALLDGKDIETQCANGELKTLDTFSWFITCVYFNHLIGVVPDCNHPIHLNHEHMAYLN